MRLNQPLGAILHNAEAAEVFLQNGHPDIEEIRAILADIRQDDQRAGAIIDRMRTLVRPREFQGSRLNMNTLVGEVVTLVRPDTERRNMKVVWEPASTEMPVWGDHVELQQVILNLLLNAMDAMNDCPAEARRAYVRVSLVAAEVEVAVSDAGHGITEENLTRLFAPFFTTKPTGLGMGLAISQTIIAAHKGRLTAENNVNGGATFRVTLPQWRGQGAKRKAAVMNPGTPTVFVVDDDASFLTSVARLLRASRFAVRTFPSAAEFLSQLPADAAGCVVADLQMPGMNGSELQELLARTRNPLPLVFLTWPRRDP